MAGRQMVLLVKGKWFEQTNGVWTFLTDRRGNTKAVFLSSRMSFCEVVKLVKEKLCIKEDVGVTLTFQWPAFMLMDDGRDAPPVLMSSDDEVSLFVEMRAEIDQLNLCVTTDENTDDDVVRVPGENEEALVVYGTTEEDGAAGDEAYEEENSERLDELAVISLAGEEPDFVKDDDIPGEGIHENVDDAGEIPDQDNNDNARARDKGKAKVPDGDSGYVPASHGLEKGECSRPSGKYSCADETINGVFSETEEVPAMFGRDAPPVVDDVSDDGIDSALRDMRYEGDGIFVGRIFRNKVECKIKLAIHAINRKFHFRTPRSTPNYMEFLCINSTCPWRIYASLMDATGNFQIKKAKLKHTCPIEDRRKYHKQATTQVIGELIQTRFVAGEKSPGPIEIQRIMLQEFQVNISYWKAWRCRELALEKAFGSVSGSFALLPSYLVNLQNSNPGTVCKTEFGLDKNGCQRFKYLFISFAASIAGLPYLRPVVIIDGTHLVGRYGGCLICASAQDGNFQIYPIAYAVVDSENDASYEWFFNCLNTIIPNDRDVMFVSDRHGSFYSGLKKVYPDAGHGACLVHLARNITARFKESWLPGLMVRAEKAHTVYEFQQIFADLQSVSPSCAKYLLDLGLPHWTRAYCIGERYNVMTTNVAKSLNKVLKECREFPLISMLKAIRMSLISWFVRRKAASAAEQHSINQKVRDLMDENYHDSTKLKVVVVGEDEYEVYNRQGERFEVNLGLKTCSCREFQMLLIPCHHAMAASSLSKIELDKLVGEVYTTRYRRSLYEGAFHPVPTPVSSGGTELLPPLMRRPPGRPRKTRIPSRGEFKRRSRKAARGCSRCLGKGNNKASCKLPVHES
ncbi:uncharacterized protein LOC112086097 [Eutrema salsugineum]|uniref:uncharacterized protein LOC112086097 n=1 Tax=Eutrema salsugineum TaxID=72664 RepID=UPI000CED7754|nr:uncharacterized protein LOC112086097 [Eutrema salsugineum]